MNKKTTIKTFKYIIAFIAFFILLWEIQRSFTSYPSVHLGKIKVLEEHPDAYNLNDYLGDYSTFGYFTTISNILMIFVLVLAWMFQFKVKPLIRVSVFTYMCVTTIIFWSSIAPNMVWDKSYYFSAMMSYEHTIPTILGFFLIKKTKLDFKIKQNIISMLIIPLLYVIFSLGLYIYTKGESVIYPFLNFKNFFYLDLGLPLSMFISILFLTASGLLFSGIFCFSSKYIFKKI